MNSSQGLSPYNALLKTCIYYRHIVNECLIVHGFKVLSKHVFFKKHEIHVKKKGLYITQFISEYAGQKVQQL